MASWTGWTEKTRFTEFHLKATLHLPAGSNEAKARKILDKANSNCLITNSLNGIEYLDATRHHCRLIK